jgi:16S rRNA (uracil1498-N3)-methyltransferase
MTDRVGKIRLFVEADLGPEAAVPLAPERAHYLFTVMRLGEGAEVAVFNGRDGEWVARRDRRGAGAGRWSRAGSGDRSEGRRTCGCASRRSRRRALISLWKKPPELGCARVVPVFTRNTNAERIRPERLRAHAVEAAEQCGETFVPEVAEAVRLDALLDGWEPGRRLMFCDEARDARPAAEALAGAEAGPWAILVGPEGGFAAEEAARLRGMGQVLRVTLGPRVLRADTAAVAAVTLWQAALGDWR